MDLNVIFDFAKLVNNGITIIDFTASNEQIFNKVINILYTDDKETEYVYFKIVTHTHTNKEWYRSDAPLRKIHLKL